MSAILFPNDSAEEPWRVSEIKKAADARSEATAGFPNLHAHSLLGLWGAFECFIDDLVVAFIETDPIILQGVPFEKVKLPVSTLTITDTRLRSEAIYSEASRITGADLAIGTTKFERLLKLVGLDGAVPKQISENVFLAQQIRNVWAHRGGKADSKFTERCSSLGFSVGDTVNMDFPFFSPLMHGLHMYSMVIINRYRSSKGLNLLSAACPGYLDLTTKADPVVR